MITSLFKQTNKPPLLTKKIGKKIYIYIYINACDRILETKVGRYL